MKLVRNNSYSVRNRRASFSFQMIPWGQLEIEWLVESAQIREGDWFCMRIDCARATTPSIGVSAYFSIMIFLETVLVCIQWQFYLHEETQFRSDLHYLVLSFPGLIVAWLSDATDSQTSKLAYHIYVSPETFELHNKLLQKGKQELHLLLVLRFTPPSTSLNHCWFFERHCHQKQHPEVIHDERQVCILRKEQCKWWTL